MEELRPDILNDGSAADNEDRIDERVVAPTETLDDRDETEVDFTVNEALSCSNTNYGGADPAL